MVKKCHMRNSSIKQTLSRRKYTSDSSCRRAETTQQDGDEDSSESTEVSAWKETVSRNEDQKVTKSTSRRNEQEATENTKHGIRSAEGDERTVQSR